MGTADSGLSWLSLQLSSTDWTAFWIVAAALAVAVWPAGRLVGLFTEPWRRRIEEEAREGLAHAGLWIRRLERILVVLSVLVGRYKLIGFLVAAKSILRFADIRTTASRREAEYILVGTLPSFTAAIAIGLLARRLLP